MRSIGRRAAMLAFVALAAVGCSDSQDPGLDPAGDQPGTTSNTLGQCPPGGPDETTQSAGCIDENGQLVRP